MMGKSLKKKTDEDQMKSENDGKITEKEVSDFYLFSISLGFFTNISL